MPTSPQRRASHDAGDERAPRRIPRDGLLFRPRAVHRRAMGALHHRPAVRRRGGRAGRRPVLGTGRGLLAAGQAAARARHRRRGHQGLRVRGHEPDGVRAGHDGTAPRRRQPRGVPRRARGPGHELDRDVRLGGAEGALAAGHGGDGQARCVRPDRTGARLGLGRPGTSARRDGDNWVLNGRKRWIGLGSVADLVVVWARNPEDGQVNGFVLEKGTPGYQAQVIEGKVSLRSVWQAEITLDNVRVPAENRLPGARSFKDTTRILATTRSTCAWGALGHATAAYDAALRYAQERRQFGEPLASFQIIQQRLVSMLADLTAMQLYCLQIGRLAEAGRLTPTVAGLAKMHNTRKARAITAEARDMLGGNGILLDYQVMRHMVDMEAIHTFEGTETMQTLIVGRAITGIGAFT